MKLYKSIFVIFLLLFSVSLFVGGDTSSQSYISVNEISSINTGNELSIVSDYQSYDPMIEFAIFAENNEEFFVIKQMESLRVYNNLQAIVVRQSLSDYDLFNSAMPGRVIKMSGFDNIRFDPIPEPSAITLDNSVAEQSEIDINGMWNAGYNGTDVNVVIYDNGVSASHPGLAGKVIQSVEFLIDGYTGADVCKGHGTPVAGTVAATGKKSDGTTDLSLRGSAFGASIISVAVACTEDGRGIVGDWLGAFDWIVANNATIDVVNMSWGGGDSYDIIIKKLAEADVFAVSSAGNEGPKPFTVSGGPGQAADTITVGGSSGDMVIDFSSRGPITGMVYKPEVIAPGLNIMTTQVDGTYGPISGTSFSSPMTAGAVATIISALRSNSIPYNVGLIKAVLMNNASSLGYDEISQGRGRIQTFKSWQNILNAEVGGDGIPMAVDMMPRTGTLPYSTMKSLFRELTLEIPFTLVSSHAGLTSVQLTGDITTIMSFDSSSIDPDLNSQYLYLNIDTRGVAEGVYSGDLVVTLGSKAKVSAHYSITVSGLAKARALLDHRHTWWDSTGSDVIGGTNTGAMITLAQSKGIWVVEYPGEITSSVLADYDILWMPDPFGRSFGPDDQLVAEIMTASEITAITSFVNSGGKLLVDFNGKIADPDYGYIGTNATEANRLLSNFGILASEAPVPEPSGTVAVPTNNFTSPVGAASHISHFGNYLSVSGDAKALVGSGSTITTAINDQLGGSGRVLVTSTNFWMDNIGIGGISYGAKEKDKIFAENLWDWFLVDTQVKFVSSSISETTITGQFKVLENGVPISSTPVVKRVGNDLLSPMDITPTNIGGDIWEFTYTFSEQGYHNLQVAYGSDYAAWSAKIDTEAPVISTDLVNGTTFVEGSSLILNFKVVDNISELGLVNIGILLDGIDIKDSINKAYVQASHSLNLLISASIFTAEAGHEYILSITAVDEEGNDSKYNFHLLLGEFASTPAVTPTDVTTSITEQTTPSSSTTEETPFYILFSILSLISIGIFHLRRKK